MHAKPDPGLVVQALSQIWAGPATLLGLLLAALAIPGGRLKLVDGVVEAEGPWLKWLLARMLPFPEGATAITVGHVVLARDRAALESTRAHERVHVRQYDCWGPLFIPAYLLASAWALARGGDLYRDNVFERQARRLEPS